MSSGIASGAATTATGRNAKTIDQCAPRSWLTARPQSVPTYRSIPPGTIAIPCPLLLRLEQPVRAAWLHVVPRSLLTQIPPPVVTTWLSIRVVAMMVLPVGSPVAKRTSLIWGGSRPARWDQVVPPSSVGNTPPLSLPTTATFALTGSTSIDTARPPLETSGWNSLSPIGNVTFAYAMVGRPAVATAMAPTTTEAPTNSATEVR